MARVWGIRSPISAPLAGAGAAPNIEGVTGKFAWPDVIVVRRCPLRIEGGSSSPKWSTRPGLGSRVSNCEGAPDWKR